MGRAVCPKPFTFVATYCEGTVYCVAASAASPAGLRENVTTSTREPAANRGSDRSRVVRPSRSCFALVALKHASCGALRPSRAGRRMAGTAALLVDCVLPAASVRQYVLAFPYELSGLAALRPDVLRALSRIFWEALRRPYVRWAKHAGHATTRVETGAVTGVHRTGASLSMHVHFHVLCLDGVCVEAEAEGGTLRFEAAPRAFARGARGDAGVPLRTRVPMGRAPRPLTQRRRLKRGACVQPARTHDPRRDAALHARDGEGYR